MNLIILGAPGAGKGTQARLIAENYGLTHICSGDIFRQLISQGSSLGNTLKEYIVRGQLVPDEIVLRVILPYIKSTSQGYVFDGFPRNIYQAQKLDEWLSIDKVIYLTFSLEESINRLKERYICSTCGRVYNLYTLPPQQDRICDICKKELVKRADDESTTIEERFQVHNKEILLLLNYYGKKVFQIDATKSVQEIFDEVVQIIGKKNGHRD